MIVARRVYLYAIAFASLSMLVAGLAMLIEILFETLVDRTMSAGSVVASGSLVDRIAFAAATGGIGLVAWTIHWGLASRAARGADSVSERRSGIRKLYLYGVLFVGGLTFMFALAEFLHDLLRMLFQQSFARDLAAGRSLTPLATLLSVAPFWAYHARVVSRDRADIPEQGAGATLRRWYVYGLAFIGLLTLLSNSADLLANLADVIAPAAGTDVGSRDWLTGQVAEPLGWMIAGLMVWLPVWIWSLRLYATDTSVDAEQRSVLRKVYLYLVLLVAVTWTVWSLGQVLYVLLYWLLVPTAERRAWDVGRDDLTRTAASLVVFGIAWAYHARVLGREAAATAEAYRQATVRWIYGYIVAFVGSATLATGLAGTLATLIDSAVESNAFATGNWFADQISLFGTLIAVGLPVWYIPWSRLQREVTAATARRSLVRRIYLFLVLGLAVLGLLSSGAFTLYAVLRVLLGDRWTGSETSELIAAASSAAVAILFLVYNLRVFQHDAALAHQDDKAATGPIAADSSAPGVSADAAVAVGNGHAGAPGPSPEAVAGVTVLIVRPAPGADLADLQRRLEGVAEPDASVQVATLTEREAHALLDRPSA